MAATMDVASALDALKTFYSKDKMANLTYPDRPLYAMLDKKTNFVGDKYKVPMKLTNPQGRGADFARAQANKQASVYKAFYLERVKDYSLASIDTESVLASQNDAGAFLRLATGEIDGAVDSLARSLAFSCYGDSSGSLAQASAAGTSANPTVVTLSDDEDIVKFEVGQTLVVWSAKSAGTQRNFDGTNARGVVSAVDRDAGTVSINRDNSGAGGTIVAGDYLFVDGDRGLKMSGLLDWIPASAPSSASFFGVDRSVDPVRLAGTRYNASGIPIEEALITAARKVAREGGRPNHLFISFEKFAALEKSLGTKAFYIERKIGDIGFKGLRINGPKGDIEVFADQDCPNAYGFMLDMRHWSLYSLGEAIRILDLDGNKMLRESSADAMEIRVGFFGQIGCRSPLGNAIITF